MGKENPQKSTERLFAKTLKALGDENTQSLADSKTVETLLRTAASEAFEVAERTDDADQVGQNVFDSLKPTARILLGKDPAYHALKGWNEPGGIDQHLKHWEGVDETDPETIVAGALLNMTLELVKLQNYANEPETLEEQWKWQVDATIEHYTGLCMGLTPGQMDE